MTIPTDLTPTQRSPTEKAAMPSLLELDLLPSPLVDPMSYPGAVLAHSYLWLDTWVYRLHPDLGGGRSGWGVDIDGGLLGGRVTAGSGVALPLDDALGLAGGSTMSVRSPVLAFGSNAAPAQLLTKFASLDPAGRVVPVLRGSVSGLALSHSPHVSPPGYVPYVVVDGDAGADLPAFVLWLDEQQLIALGRTEPNYRLVRVPAGRYPLTVESMDAIRDYRAYKGKWGALRWSGQSGPAPGGSQSDVFGKLAGYDWFRQLVGPGDVRRWMARLSGDPALRDWVRTELAASGLVVDDGWHELR